MLCPQTSSMAFLPVARSFQRITFWKIPSSKYTLHILKPFALNYPCQQSQYTSKAMRVAAHCEECFYRVYLHSEVISGTSGSSTRSMCCGNRKFRARTVRKSMHVWLPQMQPILSLFVVATQWSYSQQFLHPFLRFWKCSCPMLGRGGSMSWNSAE